MKYQCPILVVDDLDQSRMFYEDLLGQAMIVNLGGFMYFSGEFAIRDRRSWKAVEPRDLMLQHARCQCAEVYFEEADFDAFVARLETYPDIEFIHGPTLMAGRRLVRFYDPDGHIVVVGEDMAAVIERYLAQGLSFEDISARTHYPLEFIQARLRRDV